MCECQFSASSIQTEVAVGQEEILEGLALTLGICFTYEVSRMYFGSTISSWLKITTFLLRFVCPSKCSLWSVVVVPLVPHSERKPQ